MIIHMRLAPPQVGTITVKTPFMMVTENEEKNVQSKYKIIYKIDRSYKCQYNIRSFEVINNE